MINTSGQPLATPSPLGADGGSFSITRTGNQAGGGSSTGTVTVPIPIGPGFPGIPGITVGRGRSGRIVISSD
jgi:hypothetical protein